MADEKFVEECIHLLAPNTCSLCRPPRPWKIVYNFTAKYDSTCALCHQDISPRQKAAIETNGTDDRVIHQSCPDPDPWRVE